MNAMVGADIVFHLVANADVRFGLHHPLRDLEQNTIGTFIVLEAARENGIKAIAFSSTGSVYGEAPIIPTREDAPFPIQTSLYGASKLAGEGLISVYCEGYGAARLDLPYCFDPQRAIHARACVRFLQKNWSPIRRGWPC